jgi:hypothetical protein
MTIKPMNPKDAEAILKSRLHRFESAQLVWDALKDAGPTGLKKQEILDQTGLTTSQLNYAFGFIKDVLMEKYEQPLVCNATTYRYSLPSEVLDAKDYIDFRVGGILTMIRRVEQVANASVEKWNDQQMKDVQLKVRHLRETLENIVGVGN